MTRRFAILFAVVLVAAAILSVVRLPRTERPAAPHGVDASRPAAEIGIRIEPDGSMAPGIANAVKDSRVVFTVTNASATPARIQLMGYDDRLGAVVIPAAQAWRDTLVADRPGDDFAWIVNGKPAGRFIVAGSHLVEGHR